MSNYRSRDTTDVNIRTDAVLANLLVKGTQTPLK